MTILTSYKRHNRASIKLAFGVPLEDVFPDGDVHPSIKKLLLEIFDSLAITSERLQNVLSFETPKPDHIFLEATLTQCKPIDFMPAGTLLWMLRHFLGSLPLPLLPKYTDGKNFVWLKLSDRCRYTFERYVKDRNCNRHLVELISDELLRLPPVNLLMIGYLVNFLRSLILRPGREAKINKSATQALIRYFASTIFVRPYRPSHIPKKEKLYHPLMLYLLIRWPEIQAKCMEKQRCCFVPVGKRVCVQKVDQFGTQSSLGEEYLETIEECGSTLSNASETTRLTSEMVACQVVTSQVDACQVDVSQVDACQIDVSQVDACQVVTRQVVDSQVDASQIVTRQVDACQSDSSASSDSYVTLCDLDVLKDAASQTDSFQNKNACTQTAIPRSDDAKFHPNLVERKIFRKIAATQTTPRIENGTSRDSLVAGSDQYIYDEFEQMLGSGNSSKCELIDRISRIGWTYSPKVSQVKMPEIGWKFPVEQYKICYGNAEMNSGRSDLDEDVTREIAGTSLNNGSERNTRKQREKQPKPETDLEDQDSRLPSSTNLNHPVEFNEAPAARTPLNARTCTKSKKSLVNFGKLMARVDLLKVLKRRKVTGSNSAEDVTKMSTKIKYQKMGGVKSSLF